MSELRRASHSIFSIQLHIVFVTKFRKPVITPVMLERLREIFGRVLVSNRSILLECNGEADHVHLLADIHPDNNIANLVNAMKSASSRIIRKEFAEEVNQAYWGDAKFWSGSYCAVSVGGAPLDVVKQYIQDQGRDGRSKNPQASSL